MPKGVKGFQKGHIPWNKNRTIPWAKALPYWWKKGHIPWNKGLRYSTVPCPEEKKKKISQAQIKRDASYFAIHIWVNHWKGKPQKCIFCGITNKNKKLEWANIDHRHKRDLNDYIPACCSCHRKYDYYASQYKVYADKIAQYIRKIANGNTDPTTG